MRQEKQFLLDEVKEKIEDSNAFVIARYQSLKSEANTAFRDSLHEVGGELEVVKKRVLIKAAEAAGVMGVDLEQLEGSIALVFAKDDPINATKAVFQFSKENEGVLEVLGGHIDGQLYDAAQVKKLSQLPGRDEMRSQLLGLFEAPMSQTLATMEALLTSVIHCLENKRLQESE